MSDKQHLYLVDGSAYIFRAYHRLPPLTNPEGTPVGAVYGYTTMLWKLADDLDKADGPTHLAVVLDKSGKSFRNEIYPEYKANRPPAPEDRSSCRRSDAASDRCRSPPPRGQRPDTRPP